MKTEDFKKQEKETREARRTFKNFADYWKEQAEKPVPRTRPTLLEMRATDSVAHISVKFDKFTGSQPAAFSQSFWYELNKRITEALPGLAELALEDMEERTEQLRAGAIADVLEFLADHSKKDRQP